MEITHSIINSCAYFIVLILLITTAFQGHIYNWENDIIYNSDGKVDNLKINFKLDSGLKEERFINILFPFNIGSTTNNDLPAAKLFEYN